MSEERGLAAGDTLSSFQKIVPIVCIWPGAKPIRARRQLDADSSIEFRFITVL